MPLLSGINPKKYYTAQIYVSYGIVYAEIVYTHNCCKVNDDLYLVAMHKHFGSIFKDEPREKDYIKANKWVEEQLSLLEKYTTHIVTRPSVLREKTDE